MVVRFLSLIATALILSAPAQAAEIEVLSTNALKTVLEDLGPKFEQSSGNKVAITWGTTAQVRAQIETGAMFDIAAVTDSAADDLIKEGELTSQTALARSGIAIAIQKGAPKPDLRTVDDFKKMLLSAKSIAWVE
jgi:molybdate transport system substrate-binding protein